VKVHVFRLNYQSTLFTKSLIETFSKKISSDFSCDGLSIVFTNQENRESFLKWVVKKLSEKGLRNPFNGIEGRLGKWIPKQTHEKAVFEVVTKFSQNWCCFQGEFRGEYAPLFCAFLHEIPRKILTGIRPLSKIPWRLNTKELALGQNLHQEFATLQAHHCIKQLQKPFPLSKRVNVARKFPVGQDNSRLTTPYVG
jgi:hypothetical protein